MVSKESVNTQLKRLGFKRHGWGKSEVNELANILLPDEEIYECVNGLYEGGFALLLATDVRVLLVDKKPLNYLTVEDLRFDMINEIDYSHRLIGARIAISAGNKNLTFHSYNQQRLRKLINHVQHFIAEAKKKQSTHQEGQSLHLERINEQLQAYLKAQHDYQQQLQEAQRASQSGAEPVPLPEPVRPAPELSDYLLARSLMTQYEAQQAGAVPAPGPPSVPVAPAAAPAPVAPAAPTRPEPVVPDARLDREMYEEGLREVFGGHVPEAQADADQPAAAPVASPDTGRQAQRTIALPGVPAAARHLVSNWHNPLEVNPMRIAYSKLPMVLRNRRFGRPSLYPHIKVRPEVSSVAAEPDMAGAA